MNLSDPIFIETARGRFAYREGGDPAGRPLVLLHGWPESSYCWNAVAGRLKSGLRLIAPDLRGLGDSNREPARDAYRKDALAADVLAVLDALQVDAFQLVGHDWGGAVAQEAALTAPQRVARLALMCIPVINNTRGNLEASETLRAGGSRSLWYQVFQQQQELPERMIPGNEDAWLRYFLRDGRGEPLAQDAIDEYVRYYRIPGTPRAGANYYRTMRDDTRRWFGLGQHVWTMPSLYIVGSKDPVIIPTYRHHAERCFKSVRVQQIDAGHFVQEERPVEIAALLNDFLESSERN